MRKITVKYEGTCSKCGASLPVGSEAMYEKTTGIFCVGCEPVEVEDIRLFRLKKAQARADMLERKAGRLESLASKKQAAFNTYRQDIAWLTQPGYISGRDKVIKRYEKGFELQKEAEQCRDKAESVMIYKTRVKGDAARADAALREARDQIVTVGSRVFDHGFGEGTVTRIFAKSYRVRWDRGSEFCRDKIYCHPINPDGSTIHKTV